MLKGSKRIRAFIFLITLVTGSLSSPWILLAETPQVEAGIDHTVGLKTDGTLLAVGFCDNGQCDVNSWTGIQQVAAGYNHTVGLKADGTVVAVGENEDGQCDVDSWTGIRQVAARYNHTVGLKTDGTVVAVGENEDGQCDVDSWTGIRQVTAGDYHTVGLKADGTVVAVGENEDGQCDVNSWTGIQQVAAGGVHTVGLKADGTVVAVGWNIDGQCDVDSWTGIQQVTAGDYHTVGLKADGTVVAVGENEDGQCDVDSWTGIQQVTAGDYHTVGLKADGTVVAVGENEDGQCDVDDWNLISASPDDPNWVTISGSIAYNGTPLCAMVLANGQYMFSCGENQGTYELDVPLNENSEITLFAFVDGLAPFKVTSEPSFLPSNIEMQLASPDSKTPTVTSTVDESIDNPGWVEIAGSVSLEGTPLCAMVLANGQYMFSCSGDGSYSLDVPLDANGEITLFVFVDGLQPFKQILDAGGETFVLTSQNFNNGETIPDTHACISLGGNNQSPQLTWSNPPQGTNSYALVVDDEVSPCGTGDSACKHWSVFNIPGSTTSFAVEQDVTTITGVTEGRNYTGTNGYEGPCPPNQHIYNFTTYALKEGMPTINSGEALTRSQFQNNYSSFILDSATLQGVFSPPQ